MVSGMVSEGVTTHGVQVMFTTNLVFKQSKIDVFMFCFICLGVIRTLQGWSGSQDTELPIFYKQSLQWWFQCV